VVAAVSEVKYPQWRERVINAVRALSDVDRQRRVWVEGEPLPAGLQDSLDYRIHILFDDGDILPDPSHHIGVTLRDQREAEALRPLGRALDEMMRDLGDVPDEQYLADPRWSDVVEYAGAALKVLTSDEKGSRVPEQR
jgi:hypothetical protein